MLACSLCAYHMAFSATSNNATIFPFRLEFHTKLTSRTTHLVTAHLSNSFSFQSAFDSQNLKSIESHDASRLPWIGPIPDDVPSHDKPLLEDKIVSVLGCMVALVKGGREDVLSGRFSVMSSFRASGVSSVLGETLPPLATFRSEMKRCCESLHVALENYLVVGDDRGLEVWRKLQRLKNVCYDSGFSCGEDYPCPALFANWRPVYLSSSKEDLEGKESEADFWIGSQVTEEGLKWLLDRGYKTIVDLREETVKDDFYQAALHDAVSSGSIELVKIPVEVGTAPKVEQVMRFASLVSDISKMPIYVHSKEGVWRTSAMVSRWREYIAHSASQCVSSQAVISKDMLSDYTNEAGKLQDSKPAERSSLEKDTDLLQEGFGATHSSVDPFDQSTFPNKINEETQSNGTSGENFPNDRTSSHDGESYFPTFSSKANPLEAQVPPRDIFSKKEMSRFMESKKISKLSRSSNQVKRLERLPDSRSMHNRRLQGQVIINSGLNPEPKIVGPAGSSNGSAQTAVGNKLKLVSMNTSSSVRTTVNAFSEREMYCMPGANDIDNTTDSQRILADEDKAGEGLGFAEGDMCASSTGVVRLQSRKKAEMFLVRTDGFSCVREKVTESSLAFTHPSIQQQMLMWKSTPKTVLLLKKPGKHLMEEAKEVASFLYYQEKMNVFVEPDVHDIFARITGFGFVQTFYIQDTCDLHEKVDFVACLGGDGVILHASNLFRGAVPPVVSFNLGSLGFLTSHSFEDYKQDLRQIIHGNNKRDGVYITLRMRLRCEIFRKGKAMPGKVFDILNEVVVDRGSNPYLSKIECYEHDRLITKVQGDGVIIATPTGSTAYSTAAGGSMVHPNVPCMLFTPICPHSLSFRPVILPDSAQLELKIPEDARSNAWVSFDGKKRQQLSRGDSVRISMSQHPLPTVNKFDQTGDWFHSLIRCLNWNERLDQKAL
ncbi:unnamed protein product [Vicia faba]|uniref:NAD(+) kinase n=1 Tax=Vicia faba TaxID=3906 RepID=A0AAV0ZMT7_VICFA|nr:unnamed protein product [Vicia faba]